MSVLTKILTLPYSFPIVRGMMSYAIIWPTCSIVQEYLEHGRTLEGADWSRAARFGVFGSLFMAPVFYGWMKYSSRYFTRKDLITAITRSAIEQVIYSPLAMSYFFFGMSLLEGKSYTACLNEVRAKFWPTYKTGLIFWPLAQTLNFYFVSEKNRIVFASMASFLWTVYLAHVKGKQLKHDYSIIDPLPTQDSLLSDAGQKVTTLVASDQRPDNARTKPKLVSDKHSSQFESQSKAIVEESLEESVYVSNVESDVKAAMKK